MHFFVFLLIYIRKCTVKHALSYESTCSSPVKRSCKYCSKCEIYAWHFCNCGCKHHWSDQFVVPFLRGHETHRVRRINSSGDIVTEPGLLRQESHLEGHFQTAGCPFDNDLVSHWHILRSWKSSPISMRVIVVGPAIARKPVRCLSVQWCQ